MSKQSMTKEIPDKDGLIFTMKFTRDGDSIAVNTEFVQKISGQELLSAMKLGVAGLWETMHSLGKSSGLTDEQLDEFLSQ
jgi:hypothetical protein